jgi:uncharacterized iron-regulated membrane protein
MSRGRSWRRTLHWLHLWLGVLLCIPLVMLGLTGAILVFDHEIDALIAPSLHQAGTGPSRPAAAIIEAAERAAPAGQFPSFYAPPTVPGSSATVRFVQPGGAGGPGAQVFIDPASLTVLGVRPGPDGFIAQVHRLHANLLIAGRDGRSLVGWLGVVMLAMGLSGLCLWWPGPGRWRAAFGVRPSARGVRLYRELHGAAGIWSLILLVIVSVSGVDLAFPETVSGVVGTVLAGADARPAPPPKVSPVPGGQPIDMDRAVALATAAVPGATLRSAGLPARPDQPYRLGLVRRGTGDGAPVVTVFVDPWAARVAEIRDPAAYGTGLRLIAWQHAIHSGAGLGPVWRILVAACGLLPALFAVTGISMWLLKRSARRRAGSLRGLPQAAE